MAAKTWTIIDSSLDHSDATLAKQAGEQDFGVRRSTRRGGLADGVDVLDVVNGAFSFRLLPTRGMGIWDATLQGERFGWRSPVRGPVHPQFVDLGEPSGLGWLDGFDELLARCGLESNGAPDFAENGQLLYPLHGRIANRPAHRVTVSIDGDYLTVVGEVEETRFHFLKLRLVTSVSTRRGEHTLSLHDTVQNLSGSPAEIQMLYHINFGIPLLDSGSTVVAPVKQVVPRNARAAEGIRSWDSYEAEQPGFEEQVYFLELLAAEDGKTRSLLRNAHSTRGVTIHHNTQQLPHFTVWKNTTSAGDGYVTGIEPGTNFPNPRRFEGQHKRVTRIAAGASCEFDLSIEFHGSAADVETATQAVAAIQGGAAPVVHPQPLPDWCAP